MKGELIIRVYADNIAQPISNANVKIEGPNTNITTTTNSVGETNKITLDAPDISYSLEETTPIRPYSEYNVTVSKEGFIPTLIENVQIFPNTTSYQDIFLKSKDIETSQEDIILVPENTLYGDYPPKIEEDPEQVPDKIPKVLPRVIVPEYIIVHDGIPSNTNAKDYIVNFPDYIKNVASGEIYPTWPIETIKANVIAIISFTLNRIFTEWYKSKGYNFTITSSPQYDQMYSYGRTIYDTVSDVVDQIFNTYLKLGNSIQPFLAQYNDGIKTNNKGWLSQWGSKDLGDKGYNAFDILKNYYGNNISLNEASLIQGLPTSYPGYILREGMCGEEIQKVQNELNIIRGSYPKIPIITKPDGNYNEETKNAIQTFQSVFGLPVTGEIDYATWYKISYVYIAVTNMLQGVYS